MSVSETNKCPYFMDETEIINDMLLIQLSEEDKHNLKKFRQEDLITLHHSVGQTIRNYYRMWEEGNPYIDTNSPTSDNHPDEVSMRVLAKTWARLTGNTYVKQTPTIVDNGNGTYSIPGFGTIVF